MSRHALVTRNTSETQITVSVELDGAGTSTIETGIPFMDHMLTLWARHGFLDVEIRASGDTEVDYHHTVEDLGICIGTAIRDALGGGEGISRYGHAIVPMDETLVRVVMDLSNRPFLSYRVPLVRTTTGTFDVALVGEFFRALAVHAGVTLHVDLLAGEEPHHVAEAVFKAFARALDRAVAVEDRLNGAVPSTKGLL